MFTLTAKKKHHTHLGTAYTLSNCARARKQQARSHLSGAQIADVVARHVQTQTLISSMLKKLSGMPALYRSDLQKPMEHFTKSTRTSRKKMMAMMRSGPGGCKWRMWSGGARWQRRQLSFAQPQVSIAGDSGNVVITPGVDKDGKPLPPATAVCFFLHGLGDKAVSFTGMFHQLAINLPHVKFVLPTAKKMKVTVNGGL